MTHTYNIIAVSRMLKDITNNDNFFGGKIVIFCSDPRQTLPVYTSIKKTRNFLKKKDDTSRLSAISIQS